MFRGGNSTCVRRVKQKNQRYDFKTILGADVGSVSETVRGGRVALSFSRRLLHNVRTTPTGKCRVLKCEQRELLRRQFSLKTTQF